MSRECQEVEESEPAEAPQVAAVPYEQPWDAAPEGPPQRHERPERPERPERHERHEGPFEERRRQGPGGDRRRRDERRQGEERPYREVPRGESGPW